MNINEMLMRDPFIQSNDRISKLENLIKIDFSTVEFDLIQRVDTREHHFERHVANNIVERCVVRGLFIKTMRSIQSYKLNHLASICQSNANQGPFYPGQANSTAFASHSRAKSISFGFE